MSSNKIDSQCDTEHLEVGSKPQGLHLGTTKERDANRHSICQTRDSFTQLCVSTEGWIPLHDETDVAGFEKLINWMITEY